MSDDFMFITALNNRQLATEATAAAYKGAAELDKAAEYIRAYKFEIATLKRQAQIDSASITGMKAQIAAIKAEHPGSPLLGKSGKAFSDGEPKTRLRVIYEDAFDAVLRKVGIASPRSFRED